MGIVIKASVQVSDKGIVSSAVREDMKYWGRSKGIVIIEGTAIAYKTLRRVMNDGMTKRIIIAEAGELISW